MDELAEFVAELTMPEMGMSLLVIDQGKEQESSVKCEV